MMRVLLRPHIAQATAADARLMCALPEMFEQMCWALSSTDDRDGTFMCKTCCSGADGRSAAEHAVVFHEKHLRRSVCGAVRTSMPALLASVSHECFSACRGSVRQRCDACLHLRRRCAERRHQPCLLGEIKRRHRKGHRRGHRRGQATRRAKPCEIPHRGSRQARPGEVYR